MAYQTHCAVCFRVFERPTLTESLQAVAEHEKLETCKAPVYDPKEGRFVEVSR